VTWGLYRPEYVAKLVATVPEQSRSAVLAAIERILANPHQPAGCTVDRVRGRSPNELPRFVVDASFGTFITYEVLDGLPPLMALRFVRVIAITSLGEYQRPF
jgi:hypothetical protein